MLIKELFVGIFGFSGGLMVAGGVFTVLIAVGIVTRLAGKTHTGNHIILYENIVCLGITVGCILSVYPNLFLFTLAQGVGNLILIVIGVFVGIFVGCLAISVAEMLDGIPIFTRRIGFSYGLGIIVLSIALGKTFGSIIYFTQSFFITN